MCFVKLHESLVRRELILIEGGMCRYHLRRDGQITIHEIISTRPGAGQAMLAQVRKVPGARCIVARVPASFPANQWYQRRGFVQTATEQTSSGTVLHVWTLTISETS